MWSKTATVLGVGCATMSLSCLKTLQFPALLPMHRLPA
jgi:hypothetical protein